jgi:uncharacterized coiled-coil protein SlyX
MKEQLQQRLQALKTEYATGQKMLADLEAQQANLRDTLLRIHGAIQVLEEVLAEEQPDPGENGGEAIGSSDKTVVEAG